MIKLLTFFNETLNILQKKIFNYLKFDEYFLKNFNNSSSTVL